MERSGEVAFLSNICQVQSDVPVIYSAHAVLLRVVVKKVRRLARHTVRKFGLLCRLEVVEYDRRSHVLPFFRPPAAMKPKTMRRHDA
jgi:hypothetical protein